MVRTVLYALYFGILVIFSQFIMLLPYYILKFLGMKGVSRAFIRGAARLMGRLVIDGTGAKVKVEGMENLPLDAERLCFVSNHQGIFDIPLVEGYIPVLISFIAKVELKKIPFLNFWLWAIGSVLLNRKSPHSAVKAIGEGVEKIKQGQTLCIFPEGTRSRCNKMGQFKQGSLKLAIRSGAVIVPLTIKDSYKVFEEHGRIRTAKVTLYIHPPVATVGIDEQNRKNLAETLHTTIGGPLAEAE